MFGRLGRSAARLSTRDPLTVRVGRNAENLLLWSAKPCLRMTHAGRFAALRYRYTIVRAAHAAAPRDGIHAVRALNGRSEAASASSDPCSKTGFYRMIGAHVGACIVLRRAFAGYAWTCWPGDSATGRSASAARVEPDGSRCVGEPIKAARTGQTRPHSRSGRRRG